MSGLDNLERVKLKDIRLEIERKYQLFQYYIKYVINRFALARNLL